MNLSYRSRSINHDTVVREIKPNNRRIMGAGGPDEADNRWPPWLKSLLQESFFRQCKLYADLHKSECNMYCLDCMNGPLCRACEIEAPKPHRCCLSTSLSSPNFSNHFWKRWEQIGLEQIRSDRDVAAEHIRVSEKTKLRRRRRRIL